MIVSILSVIADAVISTFFEKVADNLYDRLKTHASKKAFEEAIGNAIKRYAVGRRIALAEPLLQAPSFLSQPEVAHELAKVVLFQEQPNVQVIARYWARASKPVLSQRNFEEDVVLWLQIFEEELRRSGVFQEVFASKD